jgi:hypothetical protein
MTGGNTGDGVVVEPGRVKGTAAAVDRPGQFWARIWPPLPAVPRRADHPGRRRCDDRKVLWRILFVPYTDIPWEFLPQELGFGSGDDVLAVIDSSRVRAMKGGPKQDRARPAVPGSARSTT